MKPFSPQLLFTALTVMLVVAGCSRQTALVPPDIHYGTETCADCGMIIAEPHYAASLAWRTSTDSSIQTADFDDIGCLLNWSQHHTSAQIVKVWVKNVRTADWLDASSACYLKNDRLTTPMGSGVVAGAAQTDFTALHVQEPILTWTNLLNAKGPSSQVATTANDNGRAN